MHLSKVLASTTPAQLGTGTTMNRTSLGQHQARNILAALLQTDRPVPARTDEALAAEVERNYHWNFAVNLLDGATFWFGLSFISATTIAPLFVSKLTTSPFLIGLVAVIAQGAWYLPQIFAANFTEQTPRKKPIIVNLGFFLERLPMYVIVAAAPVANYSPELACLIFFMGYAWHGIGAGVCAPAWQELIARCFPVNRRGRFFGTAMFIGAAAGAAGAALSVWLLKSIPFPTNFFYIFSIAALGLTVSWGFLALTREPVQAVEIPRQNNRQFLAKLPGLVRRDQNYRHFLIARSLMALGALGTGFITVSAIRRWEVADSTVGLYTAIYLLGQTAGNLFFGFLADRFGHKLSLEIGALISALAFALAWLAPGPEWIYAVFFLLGVNLGAVLVSGILVILEFSEPERRPTYAGMANTTVGVVSIIAPLLGAWLAILGYGWLFAAGTAINLVAAAAMHWWVKEPRWAETVRL
jgi:MFS family permease